MPEIPGGGEDHDSFVLFSLQEFRDRVHGRMVILTPTDDMKRVNKINIHKIVCTCIAKR